LTTTFIRKTELLKLLPLGRTQLDAAIKAGQFPAPVKLTDGGRRIAWLEEEIEAWLEARVAARERAMAEREAAREHDGKSSDNYSVWRRPARDVGR
jgi:prophage regulatory protein